MSVIYTSKRIEDFVDLSCGLILQPVSCEFDNDPWSSSIDNQFPHVDKERRKYIKACSKKGVNPSGTVQFIPADVWALGMVDTMDASTATLYDGDHTGYIVNLFSSDNHSFKRALIRAKKIAASLGLSPVLLVEDHAINATMKIVISDVFDHSPVNMEVCVLLS